LQEREPMTAMRGLLAPRRAVNEVQHFPAS
jgi:hypothetical protein